MARLTFNTAAAREYFESNRLNWLRLRIERGVITLRPAAHARGDDEVVRIERRPRGIVAEIDEGRFSKRLMTRLFRAGLSEDQPYFLLGSASYGWIGIDHLPGLKPPQRQAVMVVSDFETPDEAESRPLRVAADSFNLGKWQRFLRAVKADREIEASGWDDIRQMIMLAHQITEPKQRGRQSFARIAATKLLAAVQRRAPLLLAWEERHPELRRQVTALLQELGIPVEQVPADVIHIHTRRRGRHHPLTAPGVEPITIEPVTVETEMLAEESVHIEEPVVEEPVHVEEQIKVEEEPEVEAEPEDLPPPPRRPKRRSRRASREEAATPIEPIAEQAADEVTETDHQEPEAPVAEETETRWDESVAKAGESDEDGETTSTLESETPEAEVIAEDTEASEPVETEPDETVAEACEPDESAEEVGETDETVAEACEPDESAEEVGETDETVAEASSPESAEEVSEPEAGEEASALNETVAEASESQEETETDNKPTSVDTDEAVARDESEPTSSEEESNDHAEEPTAHRHDDQPDNEQAGDEQPEIDRLYRQHANSE